VTESRAINDSHNTKEKVSLEQQNSFSLLMKLIHPYRTGYLLSVMTAILGVACGLVPYFAVAQTVNLLIAGNRIFPTYVIWGMVALIAFLLKSILHGMSTHASHKATFFVMSEIRRQLASKLTRVPMGYLTDTPSGKLKNVMVERVEQMEVPLAHIIPEMTANLLVPVAIIIYLFTLDWRMALVSLVTIPIGMLCYMAQMKEYPKKYGAVVQAGKHMSATTVEYVNGIDVIKAFNQSASSYARFTDAVHGNTELILDWMRSTQGYSALMMTIWPAVLIGVLPVGCVFYMNGSLDAPTFITIMILALGIVGPLVAAIFLTDDFSKISTIVGEIGSVLDEPDLNRPAQKKSIGDTDIALREVRFSYKNTPVLCGANLSIRQGTTTALVGPSGSGKSTIAKLIASYWDVDSGSITIGGVDVKELPAEQVMDLIGYVSQDNFLFNISVRENIRMGRPDATDEEVEAIAKAAGCHEFIEGLEQGYDTVAGGAGGHLSGGECQRIAIARAMMKNAPIVILDEATSYTDPENETIIQDAVNRLTRGKTLIVIAHRLSTIAGVDQIAVVDQGKILATGTHEELLSKCPLYKRMWEAHAQARDTNQIEGGRSDV
jgi:ATP-binding cassette subfamily B protein